MSLRNGCDSLGRRARSAAQDETRGRRLRPHAERGLAEHLGHLLSRRPAVGAETALGSDEALREQAITVAAGFDEITDDRRESLPRTRLARIRIAC